jgi:hypothetical protein
MPPGIAAAFNGIGEAHFDNIGSACHIGLGAPHPEADAIGPPTRSV